MAKKKASRAKVVSNKAVSKKKNDVASMREFTMNASSMRQEVMRKLLDGPGRDLNSECGYPSSISSEQYHEMYEREGVAARVVDIMPEESWINDPEVYEDEKPDTETEFEAVWDALVKKFHIYYQLERADKLSGVGRFGIILLGLSDGKSLDQPVETTPKDLLFLRPFEESVVTVKGLEKDTKNERYGQPLNYSIEFEGVNNNSATTSTVHWTRVVHLADQRQMSDVYGTPRMQKNYNRLLDIRKILSGSGEMFWKGAFPGYSFEVSGDQENNVEMDTASLRDEMENYMNGLQRYLALTGVSAKSLSPQAVDPGPHLEAQLDSIAIAIGIPKRKFLGSEQGQLASGQDTKTANGRTKRRQEKYLTPMVVRNFVDRLIAVGVLPEPKEYFVKWPDIDTQTDEEKAAVAAKWAEAGAKYVAGGVEEMIAPDEFFRIFGGLDIDQIKAIKDGLDGFIKDTEDENDVDANPPLEDTVAGLEDKEK